MNEHCPESPKNDIHLEENATIPADYHGLVNQVLQNMEFAKLASPEVNIQMTKYQLPVAK